MTYRFRVGDLVRENHTTDGSQPNIGVVLSISESGARCKIAIQHMNRNVKFYPKNVDVSALEPLTRKMVTDGLITEGKYNEAREFEIRMEDEMVPGTDDKLMDRAKGRSKRRRQGKKSSRRGRKSSRRRRRTMRK